MTFMTGVLDKLARLNIRINVTEGHGHQRGYRCSIPGQRLIICLSKFSMI